MFFLTCQFYCLNFGWLWTKLIKNWGFQLKLIKVGNWIDKVDQNLGFSAQYWSTFWVLSSKLIKIDQNWSKFWVFSSNWSKLIKIWGFQLKIDQNLEFSAQNWSKFGVFSSKLFKILGCLHIIEWIGLIINVTSLLIVVMADVSDVG